MSKTEVTYNVKSGTGGYSDYDDCDMIIHVGPNDIIPRHGEIVKFVGDKDDAYNNMPFMVTDIKYCFCKDTTYISVYVLPIGFSLE